MEKVVLISNYGPDHQESMLRFSNMLYIGFNKQRQNVRVLYPVVCFGKFVKVTNKGAGKWISYIDKWLLTPFYLLFFRLFHTGAYYHICDHSNAPYYWFLPRKRTTITCHDVLAIQAAFGEAGSYCDVGRFGIYYQKMILYSLLHCPKIICVSTFTFNQLVQLNGNNKRKDWCVIYNGLNASYKPIDLTIATKRIQDSGYPELNKLPFLLTVGSSLSRKNRLMTIQILANIASQWHGNVCFAGEALTSALKNKIKELGLTSRVVEIVRPSHELLEALYNTAFIFIFPSLSEGFGWPVIEAQSCGAPVVASNRPPMPEIGGEGAIYCDPNNTLEFVSAVNFLNNPAIRDALVAKGFENVKRFETQSVINAYLKYIFAK